MDLQHSISPTNAERPPQQFDEIASDEVNMKVRFGSLSSSSISPGFISINRTRTWRLAVLGALFKAKNSIWTFD